MAEVLALCVEASHQRGMGHLFRALALAQALEARGAVVRFYVNDDANAARILQERGKAWRAVPLLELKHAWEADLVRSDAVRVWVNDRLDTDARHATRVLAAGARLASFDDRGSGAALVDLNIVALPQEAPAPGRRLLSGFQYLVLDPAIAGQRRQRSELRSLVVSMGGSDTYGITLEVMRALRVRERAATVVLGPAFAHDAELAAVADAHFTIKRDVASLATEFAKHDLAITAGGMTPCEANAAGLPCIVIATEPWEVAAGKLLERSGGCVYAGFRDRIDFGALHRPLPIAAMSRAALASVPTDGAARVAAELLAL
jgi:spore coat polysaccharide biosynthesis predicted glycosyltransferase SpsG